MKRYLAFALFLMIVMAGCSDKNVVPEVGDFSFDLPDGYSIANVADKNCSIIRADDGAVAGGIEVTALGLKDVTGSKTDNIMLYLQKDFHMTYNVEYIATHWGDENKIVSVNLKKYTDGGKEELYTHIFFQKDSGVYHIWLNKDVAGSEAESQFMAITGVD